MKDSHGRTIDYLRISLTDRCNLRCLYCMPADGIQLLPTEQVLRHREIIRLVRVAAGLGVSRVRLTGGEPLVRKGCVEMVGEIAATPGIKDVALTTNGVLLARDAEALREAGLSRVNVSLDALDAGQFRAITRGGDIARVLEGIDAALACGFDPVKVNAVAVRSLDQDFFAFARMSVDRPLHMRFIEYMPVGDSFGADGHGWGIEDVISCDEIREAVSARGEEAGLGPLVPVDTGAPVGAGPAKYWQFEGAQGTVGFISPLSRHFCGACNRIRVTSTGGVRPCLFSDEELDVRTALREGTDEDVAAVLRQSIGAKPEQHDEELHANETMTNMNAIGG